MINVVTHILRVAAATEDEWIKGGAEENRQGKLTRAQEDRDVFRRSFRKVSVIQREFSAKDMRPSNHTSPAT